MPLTGFSRPLYAQWDKLDDGRWRCKIGSADPDEPLTDWYIGGTPLEAMQNASTDLTLDIDLRTGERR
jgi:hypothetical protein